MKLTSEKALELLDEARGKAKDDHWIEHSICVGNTAEIIAKKLNLDSEKAKTLGYIHDIGKRNGYGKGIIPHGIGGYEYIISLGYDEEYANVCLTHSYLNNDINCVAGGIPSKDRYKYDFEKQFIENHSYTIYEKIISLCDLVCKQNVMTLEKRLIDLIQRYGVFDNTVYHIKEAQKLKMEIEGMLKCPVYSLFDNVEM